MYGKIVILIRMRIPLKVFGKVYGTVSWRCQNKSVGERKIQSATEKSGRGINILKGGDGEEKVVRVWDMSAQTWPERYYSLSSTINKDARAVTN